MYNVKLCCLLMLVYINGSLTQILMVFYGADSMLKKDFSLSGVFPSPN